MNSDATGRQGHTGWDLVASLRQSAMAMAILKWRLLAPKPVTATRTLLAGRLLAQLPRMDMLRDRTRQTATTGSIRQLLNVNTLRIISSHIQLREGNTRETRTSNHPPLEDSILAARATSLLL